MQRARIGRGPISKSLCGGWHKGMNQQTISNDDIRPLSGIRYFVHFLACARLLWLVLLGMLVASGQWQRLFRGGQNCEHLPASTRAGTKRWRGFRAPRSSSSHARSGERFERPGWSPLWSHPWPFETMPPSMLAFCSGYRDRDEPAEGGRWFPRLRIALRRIRRAPDIVLSPE